jgi:hypothetical protein
MPMLQKDTKTWQGRLAKSPYGRYIMEVAESC